MTKWVYLFSEGNADMRNLLGGKGANLAEMTNILVFQYLKVSQSLLKHVLSTMKMVEKSTMKFKDKLMNTSKKWKKLQERNLEIKKIHF
jgi:hypothetical protein